MSHASRFGFAVVLSLVLGLCITPAHAAKGAKGQKHNAPIESLQYVLKQLDLTAEQQPKVDDIVADLQKKVQDLKSEAKTGGDKDAAKTKARDLIQDTRAQLEKVLTPDQQTKFRKLMAEERAEKKEARKDGKHGTPATQPSN